jgi:hypothetical protein
MLHFRTLPSYDSLLRSGQWRVGEWGVGSGEWGAYTKKTMSEEWSVITKSS